MAKVTFLFAHGAGADSNSEFMQSMSSLIESDTLEVIRFDFPYMQRRQVTGKKSPPDRMPKLEQAFIHQLNSIQSESIFIGGKSMGGRVASMIADRTNVKGVVCFGYPFHPPGKPGKTRTEHLKDIQTKTLIIQGTRDPFGNPEEVLSYQLADQIQIQWIKDANHSLETLKRSELTTEQSLQLAADWTKAFIQQNSFDK